jgi:hypothetical protein
LKCWDTGPSNKDIAHWQEVHDLLEEIAELKKELQKYRPKPHANMSKAEIAEMLKPFTSS